MRELTSNQLKLVSGAEGVGREIFQAAGTLAGSFLGGPVGGATGGVAGGQLYDWASTQTPNPSMSPSGLGGHLGSGGIGGFGGPSGGPGSSSSASAAASSGS